MSYHVKNNEVAVSTEVYWMAIDKDTPRGVKVLAISRDKCGVAQFTELTSNNVWFTHWHPLPRFKDAVG